MQNTQRSGLKLQSNHAEEWAVYKAVPLVKADKSSWQWHVLCQGTSELGEAMYCFSGEDVLELAWTRGVWIYTLILGMSEWLKHAKSQFHFQLSRQQMQGKSIGTGEHTSCSIWQAIC